VIRPVALALLDLQMPIKNGIQVVEEIRKFYVTTRLENPGIQLKEPRFVFLTAYST